MKTRSPSAIFDHLPPPIPVIEAWHRKSDTESEIGESIHDAGLQAIIVDEAREGVVTLEVAGGIGVGSHAYELDVTPDGADALALWLIRRAAEVRHEIRMHRREKRA